MTIASDLGITVGTMIRVVKDADSEYYSTGDVLKFTKDDESYCPEFLNTMTDKIFYFGIDSGGWEFVDEEEETSDGWLPLTDLSVLRRGMVVRYDSTVLIVGRDKPDHAGDVWCMDVSTVAQEFIYAKDYTGNYKYLDVSVHTALLEMFST